MTCSYCKKEIQLTGEHLIPLSLIDLFPECDINYMYDKTFKGDKVVIKDVCEICNNGVLSQLDEYGAKMVKNYFVKTYEAYEFLDLSYDYLTISRWLLKILYNNARSSKIDTTWYQANLDFILGKTNETNFTYSIFSGLSVDMCPIPEYFFDNIKLGVTFDPFIVKDSILKIHNLEDLEFKIRKDVKKENFKKLKKSALLRFGSGMFLVFLWEEDIKT